MIGRILSSLFGITIGCIIGYFVSYHTTFFLPQSPPSGSIFSSGNDIVGFLPYWLVNKAKKDYTPYITTLSYFGVTISTDGSIQKLANEQEEEPGWYTLKSGKVASQLNTARNNNITLSLVAFSGDNDAIDALIEDPIPHAKNLMQDVGPLMKQYHFTDLNIDVEKTQLASEAARTHFAQFIHVVKNELKTKQLGTLTVDVSPTDLIRNDLINLTSIAQDVDKVVLMTYDYHYTGSMVTGAVSPLFGAGVTAEYDTEAAVDNALKILPAQKILLGLPLYGYAWETLDPVPKAGTIPGTGLTESNSKAEQFISSCATCSAQLDTDAQELYTIYHDAETGTYHQLFFPNEQSMTIKTQFATGKKLGGVALWALGYEGNSLLKPLIQYK